MDRLNALIDEFWIWTNLPKDQWGCADIGKLQVPSTEFPKVGEICDVCISLINLPLMPEEINLFLMGMAIDSEDEDILDRCKDVANEAFLNIILATGISHSQSEARWQLAELLRRDFSQRDYYLNLLIADSNEYVRKRAKNVMSDLMQKQSDSHNSN